MHVYGNVSEATFSNSVACAHNAMFVTDEYEKHFFSL